MWFIHVCKRYIGFSASFVASPEFWLHTAALSDQNWRSWVDLFYFHIIVRDEIAHALRCIWRLTQMYAKLSESFGKLKNTFGHFLLFFLFLFLSPTSSLNKQIKIINFLAFNFIFTFFECNTYTKWNSNAKYINKIYMRVYKNQHNLFQFQLLS